MLVIDADALLTHEFPSELYLVSPIMPQGGHVLLHGKRGLGKTQLALTLAHNVICGTPFLGQLDTAQGRVAYVQADMPPKLQQARLQHLHKQLQLAYGGRLRYYLADTQFDITAPSAHASAWAQDIRDYAPSLVIVDTLRKSHPLDENSSDTPVAVYGAWRHCVGPAPTIIYLHHDRKTSFEGPIDRDEEFRGSGAWLDEADLGMHLCKAKASLALEWSKSRTFDPDDVGRSFSLTLDPATLLLQAHSPIDTFLRDAVRRGLPSAQIIEGLMDAKRFGAGALGRTQAYERLARAQGK